MDDTKSPIRDDEFQFSEAEIEGSSPYKSTAALDAQTSNSKITRRRVLIAIGIIIVALSIYKLIGVFFGVKTPKTITTVTKTQPLPSTATNFEPPTKPIMQIQSIPPAVQQGGPSAEAMAKINSDLSQLSSSVTSLQNSVATINQQLQTITTQLQQQQTMINAYKPVTHVQIHIRKREVRRYLPARTNWHVAALIPGRAWLMQPNGANTLTVKVGDRLPGYGIITSISVINSIVRTSSGVTIRSRGQ